jgi:hypothetical protein
MLQKIYLSLQNGGIRLQSKRDEESSVSCHSALSLSRNEVA